MSRIDDALRLHRGDPASPSDGQELQPEFPAAWPVLATRAGLQPQGAGVTFVDTPAGQAPTGVIRFASKTREKLSSGPDADPGLTEQFRRLAATLHHARQANGLNCVMVTSARPGDGKTLTAVNLAIVLSESYHYNVLLVDADLRRPSIQSVVDLGTGGAGLSEVLRATTDQKLALVRLAERLTVLPAGQATANSIEALTSPRMGQIMQEATSRYDWVILDASPVGPTTDARLLTGMVGGTLFVIHAGRTQCEDVQKAIDSLGREHLLGVVLNGVEGGPVDDYYGVEP